MKVLILAAGYGTRLERDLRESVDYRHLVGVPKPLLPIGKQPLVTHWLAVLQYLECIDQVYVVTNGVNHQQFEEWSQNWPKVQLVCDSSKSNETRTGAVGCMDLVVQHFDINDHLLVIAGDTLFYEDFVLSEYIGQFEAMTDRHHGSSMLVYVTCTDKDVHKYGILETDNDGKVVGFLEKPGPTETTSRKQCPCFYFLNKNVLSLLPQFLKEKESSDFKARDATGNFIAYLYSRCPVYAVEVSGRFDVGGLESYLICHKYFTEKQTTS